jgi:hypothetical protein
VSLASALWNSIVHYGSIIIKVPLLKGGRSGKHFFWWLWSNLKAETMLSGNFPSRSGEVERDCPDSYRD